MARLTTHPDFIGPIIPERLKNRFYYLRRRGPIAPNTQDPLFIGPRLTDIQRCQIWNASHHKGWSLCPNSRFFIGPRLSSAARSRLAREKRRQQNIEYCKKYHLANWDAEKIQRKKHYDANRDRLLAARRRYYWNNRSAEIAKSVQSHTKKYQNDPYYRMAHNLRIRMLNVLRAAGTNKSKKTRILIGCSAQELARHIERQFTEGMTWENRGRNGWHIDHIVPCAAFDFRIPEHQSMCFHYSNLRPMWGADNIRKSDRITGDAIALLTAS